MKKRMKGILAMSLTATACGALALAAPAMQETQRADATATNYTNVFAMADGASIRYQNTAGKPQGIRFIVTVSDDVLQNEIMDNYFGFVVHREDKFDDVADNHYANMEGGMKSELVQITEANVGDYFYEGEEEYEGLWCANVVINQGDENTDTDEGFMERTYSAVAYYTSESAISDNVASYTYTTNRQERSVQQVASMLYMAGDSDWASVKEVYAVGTESTPMLVAQSGDNAYSKLVEMVTAGTVDSTLKFALGENVVVEEKLPDTFTNLVASDKTAYDSATFYTVNHAVTEVYSTNAAIDLTDKVSAEFGTVTYAVKNSKGVAVPVENNAFTTDAAGKYTVTAKVDGYLDTAFEVEVADNKYADGLILDGTSTEDLLTSATSKNATTGVWEESPAVEMSASFDENMKYDSESNGSYKIEYKMKENVTKADNGALMKLAMKPTFSKAYYEGLKAAGYEKIAIRAFIEMDAATSDGSGLYYINTEQSNAEKRAIQFYADNTTVVEKTSYIVWKSELTNSLNKWVEIVLDINKFINECVSGHMNLLIWQVGANASVDMTLYIDNVYAVSGAITETLTAPTTSYADKDTEFDTASIAVTAQNTICEATVDGNAVSLTDGKVTLDTYGVYSFRKTARNAYGYAGVNVIPNGTVVSYKTSNFSAKHNTDASSFVITQDPTTDNISIGGAGKIDAAWRRTTYTIKTVGDKAYYEQLQANGFNYITYEFTLNGNMTIAGDIYRLALTSTQAPHYNSLTSTTSGYSKRQLSDGSKYFDTETKNPTNAYTQYLDSQAGETWKGKTWVVSIHIADFIRLYNTTGMNILTLQFNTANADLDYSVTFGTIAATKEACKF